MMNTKNKSTQPTQRPHGGPMGGGPPGMLRGGEKARDFKGTMKKLLKYLSEYKLSLSIVLLFAVISTVFTIVGPKILGKATTRLFEGVVDQIRGTGEGIDFVYIANILLLLGGLYLVAAAFSFIQGWIMTGVSMKLTYKFRKDISEKI